MKESFYKKDKIIEISSINYGFKSKTYRTLCRCYEDDVAFVSSSSFIPLLFSSDDSFTSDEAVDFFFGTWGVGGETPAKNGRALRYFINISFRCLSLPRCRAAEARSRASLLPPSERALEERTSQRR